MTTIAIIGVLAWAIIGALLWFIFGPLLNDKPWQRIGIALFWPILLVLAIVAGFIEAVIDATQGCAQ